jgi:hypothetical protein
MNKDRRERYHFAQVPGSRMSAGPHDKKTMAALVAFCGHFPTDTGGLLTKVSVIAAVYAEEVRDACKIAAARMRAAAARSAIAYRSPAKFPNRSFAVAATG